MYADRSTTQQVLYGRTPNADLRPPLWRCSSEFFEPLSPFAPARARGSLAGFERDVTEPAQDALPFRVTTSTEQEVRCWRPDKPRSFVLVPVNLIHRRYRPSQGSRSRPWEIGVGLTEKY